jgi:hypothetical protein
VQTVTVTAATRKAPSRPGEAKLRCKADVATAEGEEYRISPT